MTPGIRFSMRGSFVFLGLLVGSKTGGRLACMSWPDLAAFAITAFVVTLACDRVDGWVDQRAGR